MRFEEVRFGDSCHPFPWQGGIRSNPSSGRTTPDPSTWRLTLTLGARGLGSAGAPGPTRRHGPPGRLARSCVRTVRLTACAPRPLARSPARSIPDGPIFAAPLRTLPVNKLTPRALRRRERRERRSPPLPSPRPVRPVLAHPFPRARAPRAARCRRRRRLGARVGRAVSSQARASRARSGRTAKAASAARARARRA